MGKKRLLDYQKVLNLRHDARDPWAMLANAIVEVAADDYRYYMTKKVTHGLSMSATEMMYLDSNILEIKLFFEGDWGFLVSHGLAPVIWEKLQAEFAEQLARFNLCYPFAVKHRAKLERRRKKAEARYRKNLQRRKRQKARKKREAAAKAALPDKNKMDVKIEWAQDI